MAQAFGSYQGHPVELFSLENRKGTRVGVLSLGGIIHDYSLLKGKERVNAVVSLPTIDDYYTNPYQINKQIGRIAGRLSGASFDLDGQHYQLRPNDGDNLLHGGDKGLATQLFTGEQKSATKLTLRTRLKESVDGFPGDIDLVIHYDLSEDNRLSLTYEATALTQTSVFDPTVHIYWQLSQGLERTRLWVSAKERLEVTADRIPTGLFLPLSGTGYDFQVPRQVSEALQSLDGGIDDAYHVDAVDDHPCLKIEDQERDLAISVYSPRNGLVLFVADPLQTGHLSAIATEPQTLPDVLHHPEFGDVTLAKGQTKTITMAFAVNLLGHRQTNED